MTPSAPARRIPLALATWVLVGLVLLIVVGLLVARVVEGAGAGAQRGRPAAPAAVVGALADLPADAYDDAAAGAAGTAAGARTGPGGLDAAGHPLVVWVGGGFCPYCAADRWALVAALDRFGSFTGLGAATSAPDEAFPTLATFDFTDTRYRSRWVSFTATEAWGSRAATTGTPGHQPAQALTALDRLLLGRLPSTTPLPLLDVAGRLVVTGAGLGFSPGLIQGLSMGQVAQALSRPGSPLATAVLGAADEITAAVCQATAGRPQAVCRSAGVTAAARRLGS